MRIGATSDNGGRNVKVRGIHHAGLVVRDLDAAVAFYGALLDMEIIGRDRWRAPDPDADSAVGLTGSSADGVMMRGSNSYLELWQYHAPDRVGGDPALRGPHELGLRHLAMEVDDVPAALERLVELGGTRTGDPLRFEHGGDAVYCRDPFGTIVEFMSVAGSNDSLDDL